MFQCSSITYQLICMLVTALAICLTDVFLLAFGNETQFVFNLTRLPGNMIMSFGIWYILQKRELKNFTRENTAILKHH